MTSEADVDQLFALHLPPVYLEPVDTPESKRHTANIDGISSLTGEIDAYTEEYKAEGKSVVSELLKEARDKHKKKHDALWESITKWDPEKDSQVSGDPYSTIFVGRLDYDVTELELTDQFSTFGEIGHVRVVRDKAGKSRGYGFIVYKTDRDARAAFDRANGIEIKGRKAVVDIERGRIIKNWRPRWLAGGLGGRHYTQKPSEHVHPARSSRISTDNRGPDNRYDSSGQYDSRTKFRRDNNSQRRY